jgi:2-methylcitrate dehydratase PrpD
MELFDRLSDLQTISQSEELNARLEILLTDFLVCARAGSSSADIDSVGARLAINSNYHDADDIDWSVMTHPGSIIWAALIDSLIRLPENSKNFRVSAYAGYRTSATSAHFFGTSHRKNWHVTTTAGTLAATSAACAYRNLSASMHIGALENAAANMGGIAVADRRTGAAVFNRSAATTLGLLAATSDQPSAQNIWEGERGLKNLFSIAGEDSQTYDGISTAGLRLFPYSGFIQSQNLAITQLAKKLSGDLVSIELGLHSVTVELLNGSVGGSYWDFKHGAASAWQIKDVTQCVEAKTEVLEKISAKAIDIPISGAEVTVTTSNGSDSVRIDVAPGNEFGSSQEKHWREAKWQRLVGRDYLEAENFAHLLLNNQADKNAIKSLQEFLLA